MENNNNIGQNNPTTVLEDPLMTKIEGQMNKNDLVESRNKQSQMADKFLTNQKILLIMKLPNNKQFYDKEKYYEEVIEKAIGLVYH